MTATFFALLKIQNYGNGNESRPIKKTRLHTTTMRDRGQHDVTMYRSGKIESERHAHFSKGLYKRC